MEIIVNGTPVVLRDDLTLSEHGDLYQALHDLGFDDGWEQRARALAPCVASWGFAGQPSVVDAWGDLDTFEIAAIENALTQATHKATLRQRFPARDYEGLRGSVRQLAQQRMNWRLRAEKLAPFVETWGYEGDPADPEAWGALSILEVLTIERDILQLIADKAVASKN